MMRGLFLCVIIIDHMSRFPGFLDLFTGQGRLWASAAEGFFLISGLVLGITARRKIDGGLFGQVTKRIWSRSMKLYLISIALTMLFTVWALIAKSPNINVWVSPQRIQEKDFIIQLFTLEYKYGWSDFLPFYVVFFCVSPVALYLLKKRLVWLLLAASWFVWYLGLHDNAYFSWQLLFFHGLACGYYYHQIGRVFVKLPWKKTGATILYVSAVTTYIASHIFTNDYIRDIVAQALGRFVGGSSAFVNFVIEYNNRYWELFDKTNLAILRIATFALWFAALFVFFRKYEVAIAKRFGWLLTPLGENSLFIYVSHAVLIFGLQIIFPAPPHELKNIPTNFATDIFVIATLYGFLRAYLALKLKFTSPRQQAIQTKDPKLAS